MEPSFTTLGCLPDFELSKLWLSPRLCTVDLREVKPVRLEVDVHGVNTQQTQKVSYSTNRKTDFFFKSLISELSVRLSSLLA